MPSSATMSFAPTWKWSLMVAKALKMVMIWGKSRGWGHVKRGRGEGLEGEFWLRPRLCQVTPCWPISGGMPLSSREMKTNEMKCYFVHSFKCVCMRLLSDIREMRVGPTVELYWWQVWTWIWWYDTTHPHPCFKVAVLFMQFHFQHKSEPSEVHLRKREDIGKRTWSNQIFFSLHPQHFLVDNRGVSNWGVAVLWRATPLLPAVVVICQQPLPAHIGQQQPA